MRTRVLIVLAALAVAAALSAGVWRLGFVQALDALERRGAADLDLASDRLISQLGRYRELAVLMAEHPALMALATAPTERARIRAEGLLQEMADKTSALALAYIGPGGEVLAATEGALPAGLGQADFVARAFQGALGSGHGLFAPERRAYYYAAPSFAPGGRVIGALVAVADIEYVEWDWRGGRPTVFFVDRAGEIFISNRSELLWWRRAGDAGVPQPQAARAPVAVGWVGDHEVWRLDWGAYVPREALHLVRDLPVIGMTGEALIDVAPARRIAGLQAGAAGAVLLFFGALLFVAFERRRTLAEANARLESRVAQRTSELQAANADLRREVAERQEAEARLGRAQAELVQAGKLSALGQMSAGISHELNQPLMAMQQFAQNARAFLDRGAPEAAGENLSRIGEMAARMARIIRNLRAFAQGEAEPPRRVDIVGVIEGALEMAGPRLRRAGVSVDWQPPDHPVWVEGGEVRLGQVMLNLIGNAADAMEGHARRALTVRVIDGPRVHVTVRDTGPGIEAPEKLFEPFYTTRKIGAAEGMGLGLSISYGLVQSFGGAIRGENLPASDGGGALFTVELERAGPLREAAE